MKKRIFAIAFVFLVFGAAAAMAQMPPARYPIKADDGDTIANFDLKPGFAARLDKLPGKVPVGNLDGDVTLVQFYDLNCPYCREAAADIDALVRSDPKLKLIFVPYAVLSIASVRGAMVEIAAAKQLTSAQYLDFHRRIYANRGAIDGAKVLAAAKEMGLDPEKLAGAANTEATLNILRDNATFGGQAGLAATPAYIIDGVAIVGHPGLKSLRTAIAAVRACGKVVC
ncbi:MAG TPA: thioredoxin domain-containing protein [Pseudolabrys sp.]|nr:thioredoxin domain-containing protein [Pseudolabrys sp.]